MICSFTSFHRYFSSPLLCKCNHFLIIYVFEIIVIPYILTRPRKKCVLIIRMSYRVPISGFVIAGTLFAAHITIFGYMNYKS